MLFQPFAVLRLRGPFPVSSLLFLTVLALPGPLRAQVVQGHLVDNRTQDPIQNGMVTLYDAQGRNVASSMTDSVGSFQLSAPEAGAYTLQARSLGYKSGFPTAVQLSDEEEVTADIYLDPAPVELDSILVEGTMQKVVPRLAAQGFYERMEKGFGYFITPRQIEEREIRDYQRLFQRLPVEVEGGFGSTHLKMRGWCRDAPSIWVDGILVKLVGARLGGGLEEVVDVRDIEAVEVYVGTTQTPLQWSGMNASGNQCGTVLIWTKGGGGRDD